VNQQWSNKTNIKDTKMKIAQGRSLLELNAQEECKKCWLDESEEWLVRGKGANQRRLAEWGCCEC